MQATSKDEIREVIKSHVETALKRTLTEDDIYKPVLDLGLNSLSALTLSTQIEDIFDVDIDPVDMIDYESIDELSDYVQSLM